MEDQPGTFACDSCGKEYRWRPELAGKRVKCRCGVNVDVRADAKPIDGGIPALGPEPVDDGIPALGPSPEEDDGIPALGPEPDDDGIGLFSPLEDPMPVKTPDKTTPQPVKPASKAPSKPASKPASKPTSKSGSYKAAPAAPSPAPGSPQRKQRSKPTGSPKPGGPSKPPPRPAKQADEDEDWNPFNEMNVRQPNQARSDLFELDVPSAVQAGVMPANPATSAPKKSKKKEKKQPLLKRGGGEPFLGIPANLGFVIGAIGISITLGGMLYILGAGMLLLFEIFDESFLLTYVNTVKVVVVLMGIGPLLCILSPTNWEARIVAIMASGIVWFVWFTLDWNASDVAIGLVVVCIIWPIVFFGFLERFGESLGIASLSYAAKVMAGCIYAMLIYSRFIRVIPFVAASPVMLMVVAIVPFGITCYLMYISFKVIVGVMGGAIKR